jgi:anti-sigma factor RsiW
MSCSPHDLRDYFFGELAHDEYRAVERHVNTCSSCREELETLRVTQATLLTLRDEEPPRRIAFVSDKIFEPNWWQKVWQSGPRLGFASAAMLAGAILVHAFAAAPKPTTIVHTAPVVQRVSSGTDVKQLIDTAVKQAIAETEARQKVALEQALAKQQHGFDLQHKATLAVVSSQLEYYEKLRNVALHAENEMPRGAAQQ